MKAVRHILGLVAAVGFLSAAPALDHPQPGVGQTVDSARYATDAYPGFDTEDDMIKPERKEPRWFGWIFGPNRDNARDQLAYCVELIRDGSYSKARRQLDALVRAWPTSDEAPKAQQALAELLLDRLQDYEGAFAEFRYLLDFYSLRCDYGKIADKLYQVAGILKIEGKEIMFVRFANTVDVRRAYETCILRAPGASWVPEAMLIVGTLRQDEQKYVEAIQVYENLRNTYPDAKEAKEALSREADVRMIVLRDFEYNRTRCRDTIDFLQLALRSCRPEDVDRLQGHLAEARGLDEREAYLGAKFYDSSTRTRRSAITAYEKFLEDHPESAYAEEIRARIGDLKGAEQ